MSEEVIRHPAHYAEGREYEPIDVIRDWELNFNLGCVVKHISRAGRKGDALIDLEKARVYLTHEIDSRAADMIEAERQKRFAAEEAELAAKKPRTRR
jgi:hypothetical protein